MEKFNFSEEHIIYFEKLNKHYDQIEEVIKPRVKSCGNCIDCCTYLISLIPSPLEINYVTYNLIKDGNPRNMPLLTWDEFYRNAAGVCIYCNPEKKQCNIYETRFNICRIYGPFIYDTNLTLFPRCVYKENNVPLAYELNLVPYYEELQNLIEDYLNLIPEEEKNFHKDFNNWGEAKNKRYEYAANRYEKLMTEFPELSDRHYFHLGKSYINMGQTDKALKAFMKSIEINPKQFESYIDIGIYFYQKGKTDKAKALFATAAENLPEACQARYFLALSYLKQGNLSATAEELKKLTDDTFLYEERKLKEKYFIDKI